MSYKTTTIDESAETNLESELILDEADTEQVCGNDDIEPWDLDDRLYEEW